MPLFGPTEISKLHEKGNVKKLIKVLQKGRVEKRMREAREALRHLAADTAKSQVRISTWRPFTYDEIFKLIEKLDSTEKQHIAALVRSLQEEKQEVDRIKAVKLELREQIKARFIKVFKSQGLATDKFFDDLGAILGKDRRFIAKIKLIGEKSMSSYSGIIVTKPFFIYFNLGIAYKIVSIPIEDITAVKKTIFGKLILARKDGSTFKVDVGTKGSEVVAYLEQRLTANDGEVNPPEVKKE